MTHNTKVWNLFIIRFLQISGQKIMITFHSYNLKVILVLVYYLLLSINYKVFNCLNKQTQYTNTYISKIYSKSFIANHYVSIFKVLFINTTKQTNSKT